MRFKSGEWGYVPASIRDWKAVLSADTALRKKVDQETRKLLPLTGFFEIAFSETGVGGATLADVGCGASTHTPDGRVAELGLRKMVIEPAEFVCSDSPRLFFGSWPAFHSSLRVFPNPQKPGVVG